MKKNCQKGFVLAETLVVTVFLMAIFTMIYSNFYPLMGEYEKREFYDDVDGKYAIYWIKKIIEDESYHMDSAAQQNNMLEKGYIRFECEDVAAKDDKRNTCVNLVKALQVEGCDAIGNSCEIYITKYRLNSEVSGVWFKKTVLKGKNTGTNAAPNWVPYKRWEENCISSEAICKSDYIDRCVRGKRTRATCNERQAKNVFSSGFQDYINYLPDYAAESLNYAAYRVTAIFHHTRDNNNYYSYATTEVEK